MKNSYKKPIIYIFISILALATTLAFAGVSHFGITGIDYLLPCVFALCIVVYSKFYRVFLGVEAKKKNKQSGAKVEKNDHTKIAIAEDDSVSRFTIGDLLRKFDVGGESANLGTKDLVIFIVLSIIVSTAVVIGSHIDMDARVFLPVGLVDIAYALCLIPFFICVFGLLFFVSDACTLIENVSGVEVNPSISIKRSITLKNFLLCMLIMLVCWLPYYLTLFPGGIGNDDYECVHMCLGDIPWTNHHPILYVATIGLFINIAGGQLVVAFGLMSFCQMLIFAATLTSIVMWLYHYGFKKWFVAISMTFFALHPIPAHYSSYVIKDISFVCVIIIFILYLLDLSRDGYKQMRRHDFFIIGILSLLLAITRNNGPIIVAILAISMLFALRRFWRQILVTFAIVFVLNAIYKGPVWSMLDIQKQSFAEAASIPLSQIGYTIQTGGELKPESIQYLEQLMPLEYVKEEFIPGFTDSYKFSEHFDAAFLDEDPGRFMKVWLSELPANFGRYVEAYLFQTSGYWCYGVTNTIASEGVMPNDLGLEGIDVIQNLTSVSIRGLITELILIARKLPVLCLLSQMSIQILGAILLGINMIRKNTEGSILALVPLYAIWLTIMIATPAYCLFRYMCMFFFLWPIMVGVFFVKKS